MRIEPFNLADRASWIMNSVSLIQVGDISTICNMIMLLCYVYSVISQFQNQLLKVL
jgi:hypothetical protein